MKKIVLTLCVLGLSLGFPATSLAAGEKSLSKSGPVDMQDCVERIFVLEEKVESLEAALQKERRSKQAVTESGRLHEKHRYNRRYYVPIPDTIECDY